ncbi:trigger factor [Hoeflea sp. YIM 152468]|uniref:trigger factor n=1 Tax=Hoeflea sp. YIM 152468 TaxID=3031759 RepID=UPI0023D9A777|nr:trigger factor [Hoeflea sp. YIM 152468]MDF1609910.1 trigger factor [Hoeflea sp. YIM 152468]
MQVTETLAEGLKRELKVVVPAADMASQLNEKLAEAKSKMQIKGFRPGKVPISHLKKVYGKSMMAQLVNEMIQEKPTSILSERGEKAATQPEISMTEDEKEADQILNGAADFEFTIAYEVIPAFDVADMSSIKVVREVVDVPAEEVEEQVLRVAENSRTYEPKTGKAADGDKVTIDYLGKLDGEPFEGGADQDAELVIGSNRFIPGFEEQLVGLKEGDEKVIKVTFPEDYQAAHLAGKEVTFDITVKAIAAPGELEINDELAKTLGLDSADKLREVVQSQIESQYGQITRQKLKRQILDQLDEAHKFESPSKLVDAEFESIWRQINQELTDNNKTFEDEDTTEEAAREEYRTLAERRVRLGLVLSKIGEEAGIQVSDEELQRSLFEQVRKFPGQEKEIYEYFQKTPGAVASLRAPIFEEKTVDHMLTIIDVTDKPVSKEELMADDEAEASDKPEPKKKKAPVKKKAAKKDDAAAE